jgi:hypothetical protein
VIGNGGAIGRARTFAPARGFARGWRWACAFGAAWLAWPAQAAPEVRWRIDAGTPSAEVTGLSREQLERLDREGQGAEAGPRSLAVYAEPKDTAATTFPNGLPPMAGTWRREGERLRFEPRFPLARGVRYRAELRLPGLAPVVSFHELPPRSETPTTSVTRVFPSTDVLPENQLKFYVQFSAPMSRGGVYPHVHVRDARGQEIELPFLELDEELWDPAMTRLTLLIDPGRIKRGVKPLEDIGPVFEEGRRYSLVLDAACRDAEGRPLRASFVKEFAIGPADRTPPDPERWKIAAPPAGSREPLVVEFDEPMDQALALRMIAVVAGSAKQSATTPPMLGKTELGERERRWSFVPAEPWQRGPHRLVVTTTIEDLAGNNIGKTFDVDLAVAGERRLRADQVSVAFGVK